MTEGGKSRGSISMLAAGFIAFVFIGLLMVWSFVRLLLVEIFPSFTAAQLSLNFTIMMTMFCVGGHVSGKISERKTSAFSMRLAGLLSFAGFFSSSMIQFCAEPRLALVILYIFYGGLSGFAIGLAYNICMTDISPWFPGHIGTVSGILLLGYGCASLMFAFIIEKISAFLTVFQIIRLFGISQLVVFFAASFFIKKPPVTENRMAETSAKGTSPQQMLRDAGFWLFFVWTALIGTAGLVVVNSAASISVSFGLSASLGMIVSAFNGGSRPVIGVMIDHLGNIKSMLIINVLFIAAAVLLLSSVISGRYSIMLLGLVAIGICHGSLGTISSRIIISSYGAKYFRRNYSIFNYCVAVSAILGPLTSGFLQDKSSGDFRSTFIMLLVLAIVEMGILTSYYLIMRRR